MATRQHYLERAAQLRMALDVLTDPLARHLLVLTIEALEEAAQAEQVRVGERSAAGFKDAS